MRLALPVASLLLPVLLGAQTPAPRARPLEAFAAERVAVTPVQFWRADSIGWSVAAVGDAQRAAVDSAIARVFAERGMGNRWAFAADVVRSARRNPTIRSDPSSLGAGRWRGAPPAAGEAVPPLVADNLRIVSALGDTRYALIPIELRGEGDFAVLRLVLVDTRMRVAVWTADLLTDASRDVAAGLAASLADLVVDP
ncbi:MAG: hypothetical protein KF689_02250 [Gemmatimonadaceae bacterium]|nr:hypothetical protein [Gemmatimonadaceae bacterium]MCW5826757.1 hypothetical protein [Gemmatimonadaceae bacterium]